MAVAQAIKNGSLSDSINAYWGLWSPLIVVPFLYIPGWQPLLAMKVSSLFLGLIGLFSFYRLMDLYSLNPLIKLITKFLAIPLYLYFAFSQLSSDLLIVTLLTFYFSIIFNKDFGRTIKQGIFSGVLAGLLVMTKEYFLYYFVAHFLCISFLHGWKKLKIIRVTLAGLAVFLIISISWGLVLHSKYGYFMFGSRGSFNTHFFNPRVQEYPMMTDGLLPTPNQYGYSIWDDPTLLKLPSWSPFESEAYFQYQSNMMTINIYKLFQYYQEYSLLSLLVLLAAAIKWFKTRQSVLLFTLITILTYPLGYLLISIESRYIWPNYILFIFLTANLISHFKKPGIVILGVIVLLTFFKLPVSYLKNYKNVDHTYYDHSVILKNHGIQNTTIASNTNWHETLFTNLYNNNKYHGMTKPRQSYDQTIEELKRNNIDYYFVWGEDPFLTKFQKDYTEIKDPELPQLHIFPVSY